MSSAHEFAIGIIGTGQVVSTVHLPVLLGLPGVRVAWVADADAARAAKVACAYRVRAINLPANLRELPAADVVLLAVPFGIRGPYYAALADKVCAVYAEKPFARSLRQHRTIAALFPEYALGVGFQRRSSAQAEVARGCIHNCPFGAMKRIRFGLGAPGIVVGGRYSQSLKLAGGGILMETGVHGLDLALFVTSATGVEVVEANMVLDHGIDVHTRAQLRMETPLGAVPFELTVTALEESIERFEMIFEHATIAFSLFSPEPPRVLCGSRSYLLTETNSYPAAPFEIFREYWITFLAGLTERSPNMSSASASILTTEALEKLYANASAVEVDELCTR